jgi:DNA-binding NarL/FixJ family response regulator
VKILFADNHTLFRDALVQYIERANTNAQVTVARDMHEAMDKLIEDSDKDLVLLDFKMPGMDGVEGIKKIKSKFPDLKVALMSGLAEKEDIEAAMEVGAAGYFPKTLSGKAMMNGIRAVISSEDYVAMDHNTNEIMPSYFHGEQQGNKNLPSAEGAVNLTQRETEVLSYLLNGAANKEIARALDLQVVTVKLHVRGICKKLGAKNRTQAALIARDKNITAPNDIT